MPAYDPRIEEAMRQGSKYFNRLIRIRRTEARTGPGGPGDLSWIWQVATLILLLLSFFRRRGSR